MAINVGTLTIKLDGDSAKFERMLDKSEKRMEQFSMKVSRIGDKLTKALTVPLTAVGGLSVKAFADFDKAITGSLAIMQNVTPQMEQELRSFVRDLAKNTTTSAKDAGEAVFFLVSAGVKFRDIFKTLPVIQRFATAGQMNLQTATSLLTGSLKAMGLASEDSEQNLKNLTRVSDVLIRANQKADGSAKQFAEAIVNDAGVAAKEMGIEIEELSAILAQYADKQIKGAQGGNTLGRALRLVTKAARDNAKEFKKAGIDVIDSATKEFKKGADIIKELQDAMEGLTGPQRGQLLQALGFRALAQKAVLPLLGTAESVRKLTGDLQNAGGATEDVAQKQLKAFSAQTTILKNRLTDVGITIGGTLVPAIKTVGEWLVRWINWWESLTGNTQRMLVAFTALAAFAGPALKLLVLLSSKWALAAIVIVGSLGLIADAVLQMTGTANLGFIDMVNAFQIGNKDIRQISDETMIQLKSDWKETGLFFTQVWEGVTVFLKNATEKTLRGMIKSVQFVAKKILEVGTLLPGGAGRSATAALVDLNIGAAEALKNSSDRALKNMEKAKKAIKDLEAKRGAVVGKKTALLINAADKGMERTKKRMDDSSKKMKERMEAMAKAAKDVTKVSDKVQPRKGVLDLLKEARKENKAARKRTPTDFQEISLSRFNLPQFGEGAAAKKEQRVSDVGVQKKLDTLIDVTKRSIDLGGTILG